MSVSIQPVSIVAAPALAALHKAAFTGHADWDVDFFNKLLALPTTRGWLALYHDAPSGFILWQQTMDAGEIITIAVAPEMQGQGIGTQLIQAYENSLIEGGVLQSILDVAEDNVGARALYEKGGYNLIHRRQKYYQRYEQGRERRIDALVFEKKL